MSVVTDRRIPDSPVDQRLPLTQLLLVGFQHVLLMYGGAVAVPLIVGQAAGLSREEIAFLINADLLVAGIVVHAYGVAAIIAANSFVALLLLAVVEGAMSFIDVLYVASESRPITERQHTGHDPLLGWINLPNVSIPNLYGPGRDMFTNSQMLRSQSDGIRRSNRIAKTNPREAMVAPSADT